jgi:hypothetical protein
MDQFAALGSVALKLHMEMRNVFYLLLPVFFMGSIALVWFQNPVGSPDFLDKIKRALIAFLLIVGFSELTDAMLFVTTGIADKIDNMSGLEAVIQMASEKAHSYTVSPLTPVLAFDDLVIAGLSYLCWAILYFAHFIMIAIYHFSWVFLSIMAPLLLLFHVFSSQITLNLFKSMLEIASWRVVWSVLSAMLKSLPFGTWYAMDGNYLTIAVLNFVIALCMIGTPLIVHSLVNGSFTAMTTGLTAATATAMMAAPTKAMSALKFGRGVLGDFASFGRGVNSKLGQDGVSFAFGKDTPPPPPPRDVTPLPPQGLSQTRPPAMLPPPKQS